MQKCTNCKRPIPDGAKFCGHCGQVTYCVPNACQQPPFTQYNVLPHDKDGRPLAPDGKLLASKPNCNLSVAGFVMALVNPLLCVIALILSAAALAKKQVGRKLALAGLVISLIELVAIGVLVYLVFFAHVDLTQYLPWLQQQ